MKQMIAYCGLVCTECPAFKATQGDNDEERKKVADLWTSEDYPITPNDINCDGCKTTGKRIIKFCNICEVRKCAQANNVETCAHCEGYPCVVLQRRFEMIGSVEAKKVLERIRRVLGK